MLKKVQQFIDWFIPESAKAERTDLTLARNFVFTHLFGPALSQSISIFLYRTDPHPGFACWTIIICVWAFWALPFALKLTGNLQLVATVSVELLSFTALFGAYHYGGVSSPFLPWLIVSLLLGFFYLHGRALLVLGMFTCNISLFLLAYFINGFPEHVPLAHLATVGWISILSAAIYMCWMAVFYATIMSMRSDMERETESHRTTAVRLRQAKELADTANRSKSIFLAKMSHELRTPLNAVIGYSEILIDSLELDGKESSKKSDLLRINAAGKHLLSLVADVLDLSKIESEQIEIKVEIFDLGRLIRDLVSTTQSLVDEKGNTLVVRGADDLGSVSTDATKLRQVILNLVSNAAKFTTQGTITLAVNRDRRNAGDWIDIQVRDTGIGIEQANIGRLFQNFGQATASTSSKYGGTGLGLALSQKFCALLGGSITVRSEVGRGSTFMIRIPAHWEGDDLQVPAGSDTVLTLAPALAV